MGLDVYLYYSTDRVKAAKEEKAFEAASTKVWHEIYGTDEEYEKLPKAKKDANFKIYEKKRAVLAKKFNCTGEYYQHETVKEVQRDSDIDKAHLFKVGYFRSSYNDGGINSVLARMGVPGLYEIFEPNDRYEFGPDWGKALKNVETSIQALEKVQGEPYSDLDVMEVTANMFRPKSELPRDSAAVLKEVKKTLGEHAKRDKGPFSEGGWSNAYGEFHPKGLTVVAFVPGISSFGEPCVFVTFKSETSDFYKKALLIVKETIEWVMAQPDSQNYYFHWSS